MFAIQSIENFLVRAKNKVIINHLKDEITKLQMITVLVLTYLKITKTLKIS